MSKVSIVKCTDYESAHVFDAVKRSVDLVGGMAAYVKPGMKVMIKPNLLSARPPEDAVDTHPEVVRAVVRLVKAAGGIPAVGDSPGGYGKNIDEVFAKSGMEKMAREEGVSLVKFTSSKFVGQIPFSRHVLDSDCFISVPKFKTHIITVLTAAVKNTYGAVVGLAKAECHSKTPKEEDFAKTVANIHAVAKPHLNIVDGIMAMEGDGPSSGRVRKMEFVMAGPDAVAIDSCLAKIMGLEPEDVLVTKEAARLELGESRLEKIEVLGDGIAAFVKSDFKMPQTTPLKFIPKAIANGVASMIKFRPVIDTESCKKCNLCKVTCPVAAIEMDNGRYRINYKKCVRCMCCHEVCPYRAVSVRRNILTKMVWG